MAGPQTCRSPHRNPLFAGKDELAGRILTENSGTLTPTLSSAVSHAPTPALTPILAPQGSMYANMDL